MKATISLIALLTTVASHAAPQGNALTYNALTYNGVAFNGHRINGFRLNTIDYKRLSEKGLAAIDDRRHERTKAPMGPDAPILVAPNVVIKKEGVRPDIADPANPGSTEPASQPYLESIRLGAAAHD